VLLPRLEGLSEAAVNVRVADNAGEAWTVEEAQVLAKEGGA
jgi:hypothetical protein